MQIQMSRIRPLRSWRKVSGYAPFAPLRREDAVARLKSQEQESLSKKYLSEMTYVTGDNRSALPKRILHANSVSGYSGFDELYRSHQLYLHAHFSWRINESKSDNFCAIFHGLPLGFRNDFMALFPSRDNCNGEFGRGALLARDNKQAVFIEDVQSIKNPNVGFFRHVISAVRLTLLDFCKGGIADERLDQFFYPIIKLGFSQVNGKEGLIGRIDRSSVVQCEPINEMVKSRPQIMEAVSDHQRKRWVDWLAFCKPNNNFLPVRLIVKDDGLVCSGITANEQCQGRVDITEMVLCSPDFGPNAG